MRNACIFNTCLVSATNVDVLIKNVKILVAYFEEEKKKKKTSVKESRKTAINEEIKLLKNAIAGKQKETEREWWLKKVFWCDGEILKSARKSADFDMTKVLPKRQLLWNAAVIKQRKKS